MIQKSELRMIEQEMRSLNRDFADPANEGIHRTSVVLFLAAIGVGTGIDDLAEFTGYPRDFIATISQRMQVAGLWEGGSVHHQHWWVDDLFEEIRLVDFWLDVMVAEGRLAAKRMADGQYRYWDAKRGLWSKHSLM